MAVVVAVGLFSSTAAWALEVGLTFQAHQDIRDPGLWPNDFHIQGMICSPAYPPVLLAHEDGPFTGFNWTITPTGEPCWYAFEATWWLPDGRYIPYCEIIRLGVLVDVDAKNVIINVSAWWTRDGVPVGAKSRALYNDGYYPVLGFNVEDGGEPQLMTLANGTVPDAPVPGPAGATGAPAITVDVVKLDLIAFDAGHVPDFKVLCEGCEQEGWDWVPVATAEGEPISPERPLTLKPDTAVDIVLDAARSDALQPVKPITIERGGFLVARQQIGFINNSGEYELRWEFEVHGSQPEEACCFPDGTCQMLQAFTCLQQGGVPMGAGTDCAMVACPVSTEPGACCYGNEDPVQCEVMDAVKCRDEYKGVWHGPGTNCDDLNGNGVADICELATTPEEACCFDGLCRMMPPDECRENGGEPQGPGSVCVGDWDGDGTDETCESKWLQPPDLATTGIDVKDTLPIALADDFLCTEKNAITRIIVWGSWLNDLYPYDPANVNFTLMLREDIPDPDGSGPLYSQPGNVLWSRSYAPYTFRVEAYRKDIQEACWDPSRPDSYVFPGDTVCWMYTFDIPVGEAFCQKGTPTEPIVYWLDVQATIPPVPLPYPVVFGWKTSTRHWNDDGVWQYRDGTVETPFRELRYPRPHPWAGQSMDLAFALQAEPCIVTPIGPAEVKAE